MKLEAPDIAQYFPHLQERVMPHSLGQPVLSDWADMPDEHQLKLYKNCGFLNRDEAAILYQCAKQVGGRWLDIGAHTGWTALHIAAAGDTAVIALDPMFANNEFHTRALANITRAGSAGQIRLEAATSQRYFGGDKRYPEPIVKNLAFHFDGVMIDGDHCWMNPLYDAVQSFKHLAPTGVILLHDFIGGPVREATKYLMCEGMKCRIYCASSQLLAVCWRGEFTPPEYTPDPNINWRTVLKPLAASNPDGSQASGDFYFELCV